MGRSVTKKGVEPTLRPGIARAQAEKRRRLEEKNGRESTGHKTDLEDDSADEEEIARCTPAPDKSFVQLELKQAIKEKLSQQQSNASSVSLTASYMMESILQDQADRSWLSDFGTFEESNEPFVFDLGCIPVWTAPFPFHASLVAKICRKIRTVEPQYSPPEVTERKWALQVVCWNPNASDHPKNSCSKKAPSQRECSTSITLNLGRRKIHPIPTTYQA